MSAGCVHRKASIALATGFLVGSFWYGSGVEYAIGALAGIILTPDLDVDAGFIGNKIIRHRFGHWAERGYDMLWYFYRKSLKHGSELSHFPVVSTVFRLFYLFLFLLVIPYSVVRMVLPSLEIRLDMDWWIRLAMEHYRVILGLIGSDIIHWGLDVLTTEHAGRKTIYIFGLPLASSKC